MSKAMRHQVQGVKKIERFNGVALLADEMQLGKTLQALLYIKQHPKLRPVVIVCPSISKRVWTRQALSHTGLQATVLSGTKPPKRILTKNRRILILNFEILTYWEEYLIQLGPRILIVDECHYVKGNSRKRTQAVRRLAKDIKHLIFLSGTPLVNRPAELWPVLNMLRPDIWPSEFEFGWRYCRPRLVFGKWEFKGASHLDELHLMLKKYVMVRRRKKKILKLKGKPRKIVLLGIKHREEYIEAATDLIGWLQKKDLHKARKASKAERLVRMGYLKRLAAQLKINKVFNWVDTFLEKKPNDKLVLFAIHTDIIKCLHERYKGISVVIDGSTSTNKKAIAERTFKKSKRIRILIGNIRAAGVSISLSKYANHMAFVEIGWTPGEHSQAEDRIYGIGQTKRVYLYYLVARGTIEEDLCLLIQKKQRITSTVLDGGKMEDDINIFDRLEYALQKSEF